MSTKTYATLALKSLVALLAKDEGRKARIQAMADSIARKAKADPRRVQCGETFDELRDAGSEGAL